MANLQDLQDYYANLLIIQYRYLSRARDTMRMISNQALCEGLAQREQECWLLDTASGAQLTVLGKIVGIPRNVNGLDLVHTFFEFVRYNDTLGGIGFGRYNDSPYPSDLWYRYNNFAIYTCTDFELRSLIRFKIVANSNYMSFKNIKEAVYNLFGSEVGVAESAKSIDTSGMTFFNFTRYSGTPASTGFGRYNDSPYEHFIYRYAYDNLMTLTYQVNSRYSSVISIANYLNVIPHPTGVKVNVIYN